MKTYIDIETIPTQNDELIKQIREGIKPPGNITKPETIEKWYAEKSADAFDTEYRKTSLSGTSGEIISIAWAIEEGDINVVYRQLGGSERELLIGFFDQLATGLTDQNNFLRKPIWIGHNLCGFDLRFIWQRCVVDNIRPIVNLHYDAKPWSPHVYDTLHEWTGLNKAGGSLDKICTALGLAGKGDITGAKVWDYVKAGKIEEVAEYNKDDVHKVREIYKRMNFIQTV